MVSIDGGILFTIHISCIIASNLGSGSTIDYNICLFIQSGVTYVFLVFLQFPHVSLKQQRLQLFPLSISFFQNHLFTFPDLSYTASSELNLCSLFVKYYCSEAVVSTQCKQQCKQTDLCEPLTMMAGIRKFLSVGISINFVDILAHNRPVYQTYILLFGRNCAVIFSLITRSQIVYLYFPRNQKQGKV